MKTASMILAACLACGLAAPAVADDKMAAGTMAECPPLHEEAMSKDAMAGEPMAAEPMAGDAMAADPMAGDAMAADPMKEDCPDGM